jgi:predicted Zn-dependent protease
LRRYLQPVLAGLALAVVIVHAAFAQGVSLLRDDEIEGTIRTLANPIFEAAGLDATAIRVYIVNDPKLNAFVAGGQNLFLNAGLLIRTENPQQVEGVVAHETGHIAGGHLSRALEAQTNASAEAIIGALLGAAAAVAGAPQVGTAIIAGGLTLGQRNLLAFSRTQEQAADEGAVTFLGRLGQPPTGLLEFLDILARQDAQIARNADVFLRTHPLTSDRVNRLREEVERSPHRAWRPSPAALEAHARLRAKLVAFLDPPPAVLQRYAADDSIAGRYARAIALYRKPDLPAALEAIDGLIATEPDNPWFYELKGQMLFENGRVADAVGPYREAQRRAPHAVMVRAGLAQALIELGGEPELEEAARILADLRVAEPRNPALWRLSGIAAGKLGREGEAALALGEYAILMRRLDDARRQLDRARTLIREGDRLYVRLVDLEQAYDEALADRPRRARLAPAQELLLERGPP